MSTNQYENAPAWRGKFDDRENRFWIEYEPNIAQWVEDHQQYATCEFWYFNEDDEFKRINARLIGTIVNGQTYVMPIPAYISMQFEDEKHPLKAILGLAKNGDDIKLP